MKFFLGLTEKPVNETLLSLPEKPDREAFLNLTEKPDREAYVRGVRALYGYTGGKLCAERFLSCGFR